MPPAAMTVCGRVRGIMAVLILAASLIAPSTAAKGPPMTKATSFHSGINNISNKVVHPTDLTRNGACSVELDKLCPSVASGAGLLAKCLLEKVKASSNRGAPIEIAIDCAEELHRFRGHAVDVGGLRALPALRKACSAETSPQNGERKAGRCSNAMESSSNSSAPVLNCLRKGVTHNARYSAECHLEILKYDSDLNADPSLDLDLHRACSADLGKFCPAGAPDGGSGGGRRSQRRRRSRLLAEQGGEDQSPLQCLETHLTNLTSKCSSKVLPRIKVLSQDVRLDSFVASKCEAELQGSCGTKYTWGQSRGRVLRCLWNLRHRGHQAVSTACASAVKQTVATQASDYRANSALSLACSTDLSTMCQNEQLSAMSFEEGGGEEGPGVEAGEGVVLQCLKASYFGLTTPCKREVAFVARVHGEAWGYDRHAARVCKADKAKLCTAKPGASDSRALAAPSVADADGVPACLQNHLKDLSGDCYENQVVQARIELAGVDGSFTLSSACSDEVHAGQDEIEGEEENTVCPIEGASEGSHRRQVQCLMEATVRGDTRMTHPCTEALYHQAELSASDFQIKYGLPSMCGAEARRLCYREAEPLGEETAMRTVGWVSPYNHTFEGSARMLECLVDKRRSIRSKPARTLSATKSITSTTAHCSAAACKKEVNLLAQMQADDWQASPTVTVCQTDVAEHCSHVEHGSGRVHACLASHLHSDQLSHACLMAELKQQRRGMEEFSLNPALVKACPKAFVKKACPFHDDRDGELVSCLRESVHSPTPPPPDCAAALNSLAAVQLSDYRLQPAVVRSCSRDIQALCGAVNRSLVLDGPVPQAGHVASMGSVLHCLSSHHAQLTSTVCQRAVVNVESEWIDTLLSEAPSSSSSADSTPGGEEEVAAADGDGKEYPFGDGGGGGGGTTSHVDAAEAMSLRHLCREDARTLCSARSGGGGDGDGDRELTVNALQDCLLTIPSPATSLTSEGCKGAVLGLQDMLARDPLSLDPALKTECTVKELKDCRAQASGSTGLEVLLSCHESKRVSALEGGSEDGSQQCEQALAKAMRQLMTPAVLQSQLETSCATDLNRAKAPYANCRAAADPRACLEERLGSSDANADLLFDPSCKNHIHATAKAWLEEPATMPGFTKGCDIEVKSLCSRDVGFTSGGLSEGMATYLCLQDHVGTGELESKECTALVTRLQSLEGQFVHSSHLIMDACTAELEHHCPNVPDGQYRTLVCLLTNLKSTSKRAAEDPGEVEPFTQGCADQLKRFTKPGSRFAVIEGAVGTGGKAGARTGKSGARGAAGKTTPKRSTGYELHGGWALAAFASFVILVILVMRAVAGAPLPGAMTNDGRKKQYFAAALPDDEEMEQASAFLGQDDDRAGDGSSGVGETGGGGQRRGFSRLSSLADA